MLLELNLNSTVELGSEFVDIIWKPFGNPMDIRFEKKLIDYPRDSEKLK